MATPKTADSIEKRLPARHSSKIQLFWHLSHPTIFWIYVTIEMQFTLFNSYGFLLPLLASLYLGARLDLTPPALVV